MLLRNYTLIALSSLLVGGLTNFPSNFIRPAVAETCKLRSHQTQPESAKQISQSPLSAPQKTFESQLIGQWEAQDAETGEVVTILFTPEGKLYTLVPANDGTTVAVEMGYTVNCAAFTPEIDITLNSQQTAQTLFNITPDGKLQIHLEDLTPGQPRPERLHPDATLFTRVSEVATLPENVEVITIDPPSQQVNVAVQYIAILSKAQGSYYLENGNFAQNLQELGIAGAMETELYRYDLVKLENNAESVVITALPKETGLPSYTGAVFATQIEGEEKLVAGICQSNDPSPTPPEMPLVANSDSLEIQCPTGSSLLQ